MSTATRKPRDLSEVRPYLNPAGNARCKVQLATGENILLHDLTRPELAAAARMVFPSIAGNAWLRLTSDEIQNLIRENDVQAAQQLLAEKGCLSKKAPAKGDTGLEPEEQALIEAFRARKGGADLEEVKALVESLGAEIKDGLVDTLPDMIKAQVIDLGVTRIEVAGPRSVQQLPDTHHHVLPEVISILGNTTCNVFLVGPAGTGKSTIAEQAAAALDLPFHALSMGPTTPTSKIFGYMDAQGREVRTPSWDGYERGGIILWDELDNGHPGLIAEGNQALSNGYAAFASGMVPKHSDTRFVATGNTYGRGPDRMFVGRNILDAATLDRFVTVEVPVDETLELRVARSYLTGDAQIDKRIEDWIVYVRQVRARIESVKLPVLCTPRATYDGCQLLRAGLSVDRVKEIRLFAGMGTDVLSKIR